jgi:site-specific recombinase XerD
VITKIIANLLTQLISKIINSTEVDCLDAFLERFDSRNTRRAYRADLRDFFGLQGGGLGPETVEEVTSPQIRSYLRALAASGASDATRRRRLSALRRFYDWAVDCGHAHKNPARECELERSSPQEASQSSSQAAALSKSEVERLFHATKEAGAAAVRNHGLLLTVLYAALRRAELVAMDVKHLRPLGRHWVIDPPSASGRSNAYIKVPDRVVDAIDAVQSRYDIESGPLWRSLSNRNHGERLSPDAVYKIVRRTGKAADLQNVSVETLRQTGLALAMRGGASLQQTQRHARLQSAGSVERYADNKSRSGRLTESAADYIDVDLPGDLPNEPK